MAHTMSSSPLCKESSRMMVGGKLGVGHDIGQHAAYVGSWIKALREDPKEILRASRDADKIKTMVMSYDRELQAEKSQEATAQQPGVAGDDVIKKAEAYAERFDSAADRQKFMQGVRDRLASDIERSGDAFMHPVSVRAQRRVEEFTIDVEQEI